MIQLVNIFPTFVEPSSLLCSRQPTTGLGLQPDESRLHSFTYRYNTERFVGLQADATLLLYIG